MPPTRDSQIRIVLVDDDPVHNQLLGRILEQAGYAVRSCKNPAEALAAVAHGCDCLITDYHMAGCNGAQLIRSISEKHSTVCIVMTGSGGVEVENDSITAGALAVLRKPTPPEYILQLLDAISSFVIASGVSRIRHRHSKERLRFPRGSAMRLD